jgi:hypothetical protein
VGDLLTTVFFAGAAGSKYGFEVLEGVLNGTTDSPSLSKFFDGDAAGEDGVQDAQDDSAKAREARALVNLVFSVGRDDLDSMGEEKKQTKYIK